MAQSSLEELLAQLDRDEQEEKGALEAPSTAAGDRTAQPSSSGKTLEETLAGLDKDEVAHAAMEEQHAFRALGNVPWEEEVKPGTRLKILQQTKPDVDWESMLKATNQTRTLPLGELSKELDKTNDDDEHNFERMMTKKVARHRDEKKAWQQRASAATQTAAPRTVPRGGMQVGPSGKMPKPIGLNAYALLSGSSSSSRSYPVPTFTPIESRTDAEPEELPQAGASHPEVSEARLPMQQPASRGASVAKEGRRSGRAAKRSSMVNGLPSYDELLLDEEGVETEADEEEEEGQEEEEEEEQEEYEDAGDPVVASEQPEVWEDYHVPATLNPQFLSEYEQADDKGPVNQQPGKDILEKSGLSTFSRLLVKDEWATQDAEVEKVSSAEEKEAQAVKAASEENEPEPVTDVDVRYQWVYTDAQTDAAANFVLDIFGPLRHNTLEARFLDDGEPTSAKVVCTIQDTAIVIEEKMKYTKTTYRGTLHRNKKQIAGTWADRKHSADFTLSRILSIRDFCFHWKSTDASAQHSLILSVWEEGHTGQPKAKITRNGHQSQDEVGCTITGDRIRFDQVTSAGWTRYEGTLAKNGRSISGESSGQMGMGAGGSRKFTLERLLPSSLTLPGES